MLKEIARKEYLARRKQLTQSELKEKTARIAENFNAIDLSFQQYILSYSPLINQNEFDVGIPGDILKSNTPDVKTCWPKLVIDETTMEAILINEQTLFVKNKYDILEPLAGEIIAPELIDIVFVPLIAFDSRGYRVGYGKGYYDRYLSRCRANVYRIGFSFFEPVDILEDIHQFDVPLSLCISPMRVYEF